MILTLDFETYFANDFTLPNMTTEAYVRDPRFEVHGASIKWGADGATKWYPHAELVDLLPHICNEVKDFDGFLCHHAQFDGLILSHVYGCRPPMWYDTYSMARMLIGAHIGKGLESLAKHFDLGAKSIPYDLFRGLHWHEMAPALQQQVAEGCCDDVDLTWDLFCTLAQSFPAEEYHLVYATVRMFTEPVLVGDTGLLGQIWQEEALAKSALLAELGATGKELRGNESFANLLRAEGVEPEMKEGKNEPIYAFAKTDDFMRDLLDGEDERVAMLAEARLSEKSNLVQTRSERLGWMSTRGALCVYLNYCGAHTTRWSGGDSLNWQNRKRGGRMEKAIQAPAGHLIVVNDASQIECRILNEVAGQHDVIERFRNHEDPYLALATAFYGRQITKADEKERGTGKQGELSCGYGAGGPTIKATAKKGTYGPPVYLSDEEALNLRDVYRSTHPGVVELWEQAGDVLKKLNSSMEFEWGPLYIKDKRIWLPNGAPLIYETLEWFKPENDSSYWRVRTRKHGWTKLYGAKLVENVIQALARVHVSQAWLRCAQAGIHVVSMEHDKLLAVCKEAEADDVFKFMREQMCIAPSWLPRLPLDSEGFISDTFAKPEKVQ